MRFLVRSLLVLVSLAVWSVARADEDWEVTVGAFTGTWHIHVLESSSGEITGALITGTLSDPGGVQKTYTLRTVAIGRPSLMLFGDCTYSGQRDYKTNTIAGSYSCGGERGKWSAKLNGVAVPPPTTYVRDSADRPQDPMHSEAFLKLKQIDQDRLVAQVQEKQRNCTSASDYAQMHNCECLTRHFINLKLAHPELSATKINDWIEEDCVDKASTRTYANGHCKSVYASIYKGDDLEQVCDCYAQQFADSFAANPSSHSVMLIDLGVSVWAKCIKSLHP